MTSRARVDLRSLALDRGGHLLVERALRGLSAGDGVAVFGCDGALPLVLRAWARGRGYDFVHAPEDPRAGGYAGTVIRTERAAGRWHLAERAGGAVASESLEALAERPSARWGLAARGATVEAGGPAFRFGLATKAEVWSDDAGRLYQQALGAQWDPTRVIPWEPPGLSPEVEDAVVQVMTYLIENETAALMVSARFLAQVHPHFREVMQLLAVQTADEARHLEVFTRRATLVRPTLGLSTVGGQTSLKTLIDEPEFATATFLLAVMGEGSFLSLLSFLRERGPDATTRAVARYSGQDEARHVAFGMSHLTRHMARDPGLRGRLARAVGRRHEALTQTAGLNEEVYDALVLIAAGEWSPEALGRGHAAVQAMVADMDDQRRGRMERLGFTAMEAEALSAQHTKNFM